MKIPNWIKSKIFWLDAAAVVAGAITYATTNDLLTGKWIILAGGVLAVINLIVTQVQGSTIQTLQSTVNAQAKMLGIKK